MDRGNAIEFSGSRSPVTGFLSNESHFGFTLGGKKWPTVEHYVQAQKFVGTQHEENIRKAKTVHQAKTMARERRLLAEEKGKIIKKKVYGKGKEYRIRGDWEAVKRQVAQKAMEAKFRQNKQLQKRLLDTGDSRLRDTSNPDTGPILESIRESLQTRRTPKKSPPPKKGHLYKDVRSGNLTDQEESLVRAILALASKVSIMEGWDGKLYPGMIEDAIYSLVKTRKHAFLESFNEGLNITWNRVYTEMPRFRNLVGSIVILTDKKLPHVEERRTAIALGYVVRTFRDSDAEERKSVMSRVKGVLKNLEGTRIRLLKKKRPYRKGAPPKLPERILTKKEKGYIRLTLEESVTSGVSFVKLLKEVGMEEASKKSDFPQFVGQALLKTKGISRESKEKTRGFLKTREIPPEIIKRVLREQKFKKARKPPSPKKKSRKALPKELTLKEEKARGDVVIFGKPIKSHIRQLLALGGKHPKVKGQLDRSRVRFPAYLRRDVEDYIFRTLSPERRWEIARKLWQGNKFLTLLDTAVQVAEMEGIKVITFDIMNFTIREIYRCHLEWESTGQADEKLEKCVQQMLKGKYPEVTIKSSALSDLITYVNIIGTRLEPPKEDMGRREYLLKLDETIGWGSSEPCPKGKAENSEGVLSLRDSEGVLSLRDCIIDALRHLAKLLSTRLERPIDEDVCVGAFMVLLPPISLKSGALQYMEKIMSDLKKSGEEEIFQMYHLEPVSETCPVVTSAAVKYLGSLLVKPELSWMSRRIRLMMGDVPNEACAPGPIAPNKTSKGRFTKKDLKGPQKALIYDDLLDPLGLSDEDYSKIIDQWEKLPDSQLLQELNRLVEMSADDRKKTLGL